jgi:arginine deiminase
MQPSSRLDRLPPYLFAELERKVAEKKAAGVDVISLGIGDPDTPTPELVTEALAAAAHDPGTHQYPSNRGRAELREAFARFYGRRFGVELDPDTEIIPALGAKECVFNLNLAFLDPDSIALAADPGYPVYTGGPLLAGAEAVLMPLEPERGFALLPEPLCGLEHFQATVVALLGLVAAASAPTELVLQPLPNLVFTRDSSAWVGEGVILSPMHRPVRRRESDLLRTVYRHHPRFVDAPVWFGGSDVEHYPATFEGGDLLVVGERGLAIGLSERTTPSGVETLTRRLFRAGVVDRILAVDLPKVRSAMHLDTIVTQVDVDAFITYPAMTASLRSFELTPRRARGDAGVGVRVRDGGDLLQGLAWAAGLDGARAIEPDLGSIRAEREQWNDANNTFAIAPGEVVAYERNVATNEVLADAGITVHTIPSYELPRGRGGPRCMSCPVLRDPLT